MKTFAANEKRSAPAVSRSNHYVHHPMGPGQQAQQAAMRKILRVEKVQTKLTIGQPNDKYELIRNHINIVSFLTGKILKKWRICGTELRSETTI